MTEINLDILGWSHYSQQLSQVQGISMETVARVAVENKNNFLLYTAHGQLQGVIRGKLFQMEGKDLPKVGDWVTVEKLSNEEKAVITSVLPRVSKISRKDVEGNHREQVLAANIDTVFIVQGLDGNFNVRRIERYALMAQEGNCKAVVVLNKADVDAGAALKVSEVQEVIPNIPVFLISAKMGEGLKQLHDLVKPGMTVVFVGSSGVGKSTLINALIEKEMQTTGAVRTRDGKGRHTTTKREIILLPAGGVLIDTPGIRELGVTASETTLGDSFSDITDIAAQCEFNDCDHVHSQGCAVLQAVKNGELDEKRYNNFLKIQAGLLTQGSKANKIRFADKNKRKSKVLKSAQKSFRRTR